MKIVEPKVIIESHELDINKLKTIEKCARICYKSQPNNNINSKFIEGLIRSGHESVIEHSKVTMLLVTDRGISHEVVRTRIASFSQESTRYCNYSKDKFSKEISVIKPIELDLFQESSWEDSCLKAEQRYFEMLQKGSTPQQARSVLPNSLKTELYMTINFRSLRNFLKLRIDKSSHPDIRRLAIPLLIQMKESFPPIFADIEVPIDFNTEDYAEVIIV